MKKIDNNWNLEKDVEKSKCYKYIWVGNQDKVNRNTMIKSYEEGGLLMIDIHSHFVSLKASWVRKLISNGISNFKISQCGWYKLVDF